MLKFRRRSLVYNINEEVKGWTFSLKQQESPPEIKKYQEGDSFRTDEKKDKKSSPRIGLFRPT